MWLNYRALSGKISFRFLWTLKFVCSPAHDRIQEIFSCRIAVYISYLCDFQFFRFLLSLNQTLKLVCQITCNYFCCERGAGTKAWSFSSPPPTGLSVSSSGCFSLRRVKYTYSAKISIHSRQRCGQTKRSCLITFPITSKLAVKNISLRLLFSFLLDVWKSWPSWTCINYLWMLCRVAL